MFSKIISGSIHGVASNIVHVEVDVGFGIPSFDMCGFLSTEAKEAKERVRVAIKNAGIILKPQKISVNVSPADIRKEGTGLDFPIAIGVLAANGLIEETVLEKTFIMGELSLDGAINPVKGILPSICMAKEYGCEICLVPQANASEGSAVHGIRVYGISKLSEAIGFINGTKKLEPVPHMSYDEVTKMSEAEANVDYAEIRGQQAAKRATLIAAAGMHNLMYIGSPGSGKTMMAKRVSTILPPLSFEESLEISKIYSIAGLLDSKHALLTERPFRSPHHTVTSTALIGGGRIPIPGEITLAGKRVLFLDELTEFRMPTVEALRQPLEEKKVTVVRLNAAYTYPADFMLVAAINPCKCGYYPDRNRCNCSEHDIKRYLGKISQPFWDRFDICVETSRMQFADFDDQDGKNTIDRVTKSTQKLYNSTTMRETIQSALQVQKERYKGTKIKLNSELTNSEIKKYCEIGIEEKKLLERAFTKLNMTARGYYKILKTARTIADIEQCDYINCDHLGEAISYRGYDTLIHV